MKWHKLGRIFCPDNIPLDGSHAANTVAQHIEDDVFRIYLVADNKNVSVSHF